MKKLTKVSLIAAAIGIVGVAQATDLNVGAVIPSYCQISLANGSSGTASIGMEGVQTIAQLQMSCNTANGAELTLDALNGDFVNTTNSSILVNYAVILDSAALGDFAIAEQDLSPGAGSVVTRSISSYSPTLADGIDLTLSINMNVDAPGPLATGQIYFPATSAPAGSYNESFSITVSSL